MKIKKNEILKLRGELSSNYKSLNSIKDIKSWYRNIIKNSKIKIKTIPLNKCNNWKINNKGQIQWQTKAQVLHYRNYTQR